MNFPRKFSSFQIFSSHSRAIKSTQVKRDRVVVVKSTWTFETEWKSLKESTNRAQRKKRNEVMNWMFNNTFNISLLLCIVPLFSHSIHSFSRLRCSIVVQRYFVDYLVRARRSEKLLLLLLAGEKRRDISLLFAVIAVHRVVRRWNERVIVLLFQCADQLWKKKWRTSRQKCLTMNEEVVNNEANEEMKRVGGW